MLAKDPSLQDNFLKEVLQGKIPVTVFLVNGVKLQGIIAGFDNFTMLLSRDSQVQLVYKHAASTVMPTSDLTLPGDTSK